MAKREKKDQDKGEKPKEKIRVNFAFCDCGWQVSSAGPVEGRAVAHSLTHR